MGKFFLIMLTASLSTLYAQYDRPFFNTITTQNGLPERYVQSSLQDKFGYLWFGTQQGLVRYDGYQTKLYNFFDDNGEFVKYASVQSLFEDNKGQVWAVLLHHGIYYLDRKKNLFVKATIKNKEETDFDPATLIKCFQDNTQDLYWIKSAGNKTQSKIYLFDNAKHKIESFGAFAGKGYYLPSYQYCDLLKDHSGKIWVSADSLLCVFNTESHSFNPYFVLPGNLKEHLIGQIVQDPVNQDLLWMTTIQKIMSPTLRSVFGDLVLLNIKTKRYKIYTNVPSNQTAIPGVCHNIFVDSLKRLWFGTESYISLFNYQNESFVNYPLRIAQIYPYAAPRICSIASEPNGNLWIGGIFKGLIYLDTTLHEGTFFGPDINTESLPNFTSGVNKLFFDHSGILWVSMPWAGLAYLDPKRSYFNPLKINGLIKNGEPSSKPFHVLGRLNDSVFLVSDLSRLFTWNIKNRFSAEIELGEDEKNNYSSLYVDNSGLIWIPTLGNGLKCYSPVTKKVKTYKHDPKDSSSPASDFIRYVTEDSDKNLWIGTGDNGLNFYNRKTGKFKRYPCMVNDFTMKADNMLDDRTVSSLCFDSDGILWVGTNLGGANSFDPNTEKFTSYLDFKKGFVCVISLFEDSKKRLWAGTYLNGLFLFDRDKRTFNRIPESENISLREIVDIEEDKKGNILISAVHGLFRLNPNDNSIINCTSIELNKNILSGKDNWYIHKGSDHLYFVSVENGIIPFNPDHLFKDGLPPQIVIESIKYNPAVNQKNGSDTTLYIPETSNIELRYNENKIVFQYAALHYIDPLSTKYAYKLEGYDKDWIQAGTQRTATYTNLSSNTYTFRVKAANNDGVWSEVDAKFTVVILPPWWNTWWAYALYGALFLAVIWIFIKWRVSFVRKEVELQKQKTELEMQVLRAQMNPHFIFNSLNSINNFILQNNRVQASGFLTKFSKLVRLILQNSQATLITLEHELEALSLYLELEALRFNDHFSFKMIVDEELDSEIIKLPPLLIQPYVENAIWHGLMHKEEKGNLRVQLFREDEMLCCKITDDGIGRKKSAGMKSISASAHKPMGMRITEERIAILQHKQMKSSVEITDLTLPDGSAAGTEVLLKLPLIIS